MLFHNFQHHLCLSMSSEKRKSSQGVHYLQSQNGNLFARGTGESLQDSTELEPLRSDVPQDIPWCSGALGQVMYLACPTSVKMTLQDRNQMQ